MGSAVEEFLRAYAPVTMAREVVKETQIGGCTLKPGHMILLSFPAANRDPAMFPEANKVIIDRAQNRHAAFGLGIHRCVGSNLARMEIRVALTEWLARFPEFCLNPDLTVTWSIGTVRGPRQLPLLLTYRPTGHSASPRPGGFSPKGVGSPVVRPMTGSPARAGRNPRHLRPMTALGQFRKSPPAVKRLGGRCRMALHTATSKLCPLNVTSCGLSCPILSTKPLNQLGPRADGREAAQKILSGLIKHSRSSDKEV